MTLENNKDGAPELHISSGSDIHSSSTSIDAVVEDFTNMSVAGDGICASCGKEGNSDDMNTCNKCKMVKYCNAACKKKHRKKHKKACEKRVAELHDEQLFKDPPPREECPICMLPLLHERYASNFMTCCGKIICGGCINAIMMREETDICPFCRTLDATSNKEHIERTKKLIEKGNAEAFNHLAGYYADGDLYLVQDMAKANELYLKAGELGCADAYFNLGFAYSHGQGMERDFKKAEYYWELAAMSGDVQARHSLGILELKAGNKHRAMKHWILAAKAGKEDALHNVKVGFINGYLTKDEYANILRAYHDRQKEMKSDAREEAALAKAKRKAKTG